MPLLSIIVTLVVCGVILWLINSYIPMQPGIKKLLNIAVVVILVLWLLNAFGLLGALSSVRTPHS